MEMMQSLSNLKLKRLVLYVLRQNNLDWLKDVELVFIWSLCDSLSGEDMETFR